MARTDLALLCLPALGLILSFVELGFVIRQTVENQADIPLWYPVPEGARGVPSFGGWQYINHPWQYRYLIVVSAWSMLACASLLVAPHILPRRVLNNHKLVILTTLSLNVATFILWFVGLLTLLSLWYAYQFAGGNNIAKAFAAVLSVLFFALTILSGLTASGIIKSTRSGYGSLRRKSQDIKVHKDLGHLSDTASFETGTAALEHDTPDERCPAYEKDMVVVEKEMTDMKF